MRLPAVLFDEVDFAAIEGEDFPVSSAVRLEGEDADRLGMENRLVKVFWKCHRKCACRSSLKLTDIAS